jgi:hypothetical protein
LGLNIFQFIILPTISSSIYKGTGLYNRFRDYSVASTDISIVGVRVSVLVGIGVLVGAVAAVAEGCWVAVDDGSGEAVGVRVDVGVEEDVCVGGRA